MNSITRIPRRSRQAFFGFVSVMIASISSLAAERLFTYPSARKTNQVDVYDAAYDFIDNEGSVFWFLTDLSAPRKRLIAIDLNQPGPDHWREIIPQAGETLLSVHTLNQEFLAVYLQDAHSQVKVFDLNGKWLRELPLPGIGTVGGFDGQRTDPETFYSYTSACSRGRAIPRR